MNKKPNTIMRFVDESPEAAVIEIYGTIGGFDWSTYKEKNTFEDINKELKRLSQLDTKAIEVRINSYGGDVNYALAIHDALCDNKATITTVMNGYCASAATIIAMAGSVRKISKNALFLIHQCSSVAWGNEADLQAELESQQTTNKVILGLYKYHCKKTDEELEELFNANNGNGRWITAQEAFDWGFATEVYNDTTAQKVARIDSRKLATFCLPPLPDGWGDDEEKQSLHDKVVAILRDLYGPVKPTNHNNPIMKNINDYPRLSDALQLKNVEFDAETGIVFTDEQLRCIEDLLTSFVTNQNELTTHVTELNASVETLTAERDDFRQKYEAMPAATEAVTGADNTDTRTDFQRYMDESPAYREAEKYL